jgi:transposase-like protein
MTATAQPRRKLSPDAPARARELAAMGLPLGAIAEALGIHRSTLHRWRSEAASEGLERDLSDAIHDGHLEGEAALLERLHRAAAGGDTRAAQWLLTHAPAWRDRWSDAAATRRAVADTLREVVAVLTASDLPPDQIDRLLLAMQARGLGAQPEAEAVLIPERSDLPEPAAFN